MTQTLSNMKQLHLATTQMALDGEYTKDKSLGWPGDTGGTWAVWARNLCRGGYLSTNDFKKLISAPGMVPTASDPASPGKSGVLMYAISESNQGSTVFLSSANFTNTPAGGVPPIETSKPYGNKGFVVFRKAGDGAILQARQAGKTNIIGTYAPLCQ